MVPDRISDGDWEAAFSFACGFSQGGCCDSGTPEPVPGSGVPATAFNREDVDEVIKAEDGENDGKSWIGVFRLKDGRYAFLEASCDYTGFDCQAGGSSYVAGNLDDLVRLGLTNDARDRLGLILKEEEDV